MEKDLMGPGDEMMGYRPNLKNMTTIGIREWAAKTERFFDGYVPRDIESAEPKGACMSFGELFMRMADSQKVPPNEKEFCLRHTEMASPWLLKHGYKPKDWTKRLARAYVAFVRDTEFLVRLQESDLFTYVYYDVENDHRGIDAKVGYLGEEWNLQFFWFNPEHPRNSYHWLEKKQAKYRNIPHLIYIPLTPLEADIIGGFNFFPADKVQEIIKFAERQWLMEFSAERSAKRVTGSALPA